MIRLMVVALCLLSFGAGAELLAGAGKVSIVPPFPTHMGGYGDRMEFFEGVHDEIYARALVIDDGETVVAVVGSGLMSLYDDMADGVRKKVEVATGIPGSNVMVSCVHNHSAPSYYQFESEADQAKARDFFVDRFSEAVITAYESRVPAEIGYGNGELKGVSRNRQQDNEEVIDTQVGVLRF